MSPSEGANCVEETVDTPLPISGNGIEDNVMDYCLEPVRMNEETHEMEHSLESAQAIAESEVDVTCNDDGETDGMEGCAGAVNDEIERQFISNVMLDNDCESDDRGTSVDVHDFIKKENVGWSCLVCQKHYVSRRNTKDHLVRVHFQQLAEFERCDICSKEFQVNSPNKRHHIMRGHIETASEGIITNTGVHELALLPFHFETHERAQLHQLVAIPWNNREGTIVQISVGITTYGNVAFYATLIWRNIMKALKKKRLRVGACGSAINATEYYNVITYSARAFAFRLYMSNLLVGNKVKCFTREILNSIRHVASNDVQNYLQPVQQEIISKLTTQINNGQIPPHNINFFMEKINGKSTTPSI